MTFRLIAAAAVLVCLALHTTAQDKPDQPKDVAAIDLMRAYKTPGTCWSYRVVSWSREADTFSGTEDGKVASVEDGRAVIRLDGRSKRGNQTWSRQDSAGIATPDDEHKAWADARLPRETLDVGFAKFPCTRHRETVGGQQVTRWVSTEWHPLVVKEVKLGANQSETRTLTSFESGEADPWLLYRMKGRNWTIKNTLEVEGADSIITYSRSTVTSVTTEKAVIAVVSLDKDKKPLEDVKIADTVIEFAKAQHPHKSPLKPKPERKSTAAGEFDCLYFEAGTIKSWLSSDWPGLTVAGASGPGSFELVEFDLGHDESFFYRKVGNTRTVRTTTTVAGKAYTSTETVKVTAVADGVATTETTGSGRGGTHQGQYPLSDAASPLMKYAGQKEQWVVTPAGGFAAIYEGDEDAESRTWTWNGIVVRHVQQHDEFEIKTELIELKLE